jgi:hypothetical protein
MRLADDGIDITQWRRIGGDDVDVDAEPVGMKADRLLDALGAVDRVERRMGVKNHLSVAVDRPLAGFEELVDVPLLDGMAAKLDLDIGDVADQPPGTVTRPHLIDGEAGHSLGELDRLAHRELACRHVGDVAAFDSATLALAAPFCAIIALTFDEPTSSAATSS